MANKNIDQIRFFVKKNRIEKAINRLKDSSKATNNFKLSEIRLVEVRFFSLRSKKVKGTITDNEYETESNKIVEDLLFLLDQFADYSFKEKKSTFLGLPVSSVAKYSLFILILVSLFIYLNSGSASKPKPNYNYITEGMDENLKDSIFTVLLFPFITSVNQISKSGKEKIHHVLASELESIENIKVLVEEDFNEYMTYEEADSIGRSKEGVDIVIWGDKAYLNNEDSVYLKIKYRVTRYSNDNFDYPNIGQTEMVGYHYNDLIKTGGITLEISDVIDWVKANQASYTDNWENAIKFYKSILDKPKAKNLDKGYSEIYRKIGEAFRYLRDYESSIKYSQKAFRISPEDVHVNSSLGEVYFDAGKLDSAIFYTRRAIKIDSLFYPGYHFLGFILSSQEKHLEAIDAYSKAINMEPNYFAPYVNRASDYYKLGDIDKALKDYDKALERLSYSESKELIPTYHCSKAYIYINEAIDEKRSRNGDKQIAEKLFQKADSELLAASKSPVNAYFFYLRGLYYYNTDNWESAITFFTAADKLHSNRQSKGSFQHSETLLNRSAVLSYMGEYQKALDDINRAISYTPTEPILYEQRAKYYQKLKMYKDAQVDLSKANSLKEIRGLEKK